MSAHSGEERLGPYRLLERLGEGGMGVVYLASDPPSSRSRSRCCARACRPRPRRGGGWRARSRPCAGCSSPFVAEVLDADVEGSPPYIVTRYVRGPDAGGRGHAEDGPLTGPALARLASGLAAALAAIHAAGVVHRDLKPGNVMLVDGEPVVIDFGIAQAPDSTRLTMTGMFMGTPGYLAPEVIEGQPSGAGGRRAFLGAPRWPTPRPGDPPFGTGQFEAIFYRIVHGQPSWTACPRRCCRSCWRRWPGTRPTAVGSRTGPDCAALDGAALAPGAGAPPARAIRLPRQLIR